MANQTLYGCFDGDTGQVTFEEQACEGGDYVGCLEKDGVHEGQIKVIITDGTVSCNDIYYACFDPTTGQFQLLLPDDCCDSSSGSSSSSVSSSSESAIGCPYCEDTPKYVRLTLSGVDPCSACRRDYTCGAGGCYWHEFDFDINGSHILEEISECLWRKIIPDAITHRKYFQSSDCSSLTDTIYHDVVMSVSRTSSGVRISVDDVFEHRWYSSGSYLTPDSGTCVEVSGAGNLFVCGSYFGFRTDRYYHKGCCGTASVEEL